MTHHHIPEAALPAWRTLSALLTEQTPPCAVAPDLWFSDDADSRADAAQACEYCPTRIHIACAEYANTAREQHGVWAGHDRTRRQRSAVA